MDVLNTDFKFGASAQDGEEGGPTSDVAVRLRAFYLADKASRRASDSSLDAMFDGKPSGDRATKEYGKVGPARALYRHTWVLSHRALLNYSRYVTSPSALDVR